jgi:hypothetical protein
MFIIPKEFFTGPNGITEWELEEAIVRDCAEVAGTKLDAIGHGECSDAVAEAILKRYGLSKTPTGH